MMADIFISYARADLEHARSLAAALENYGWSVWWDRRIPTGQRYDEVIDAQLSAARCVVALWSSAGVVSHWVREEATDARERGVLTPVRLEPVRLPLGFRSLQTVDLLGWQGDGAHRGFGRLVVDIEGLLGVPSRSQLKTPKYAAAPMVSTAAPIADKSVRRRGHGKLRDLQDLSVFRDVGASWCPKMLVLPAGEFLMGSRDIQDQAYDREKPQHKVTLDYRLAVGCYPVTFEEYDWFCAAEGWDKSEDQGWGRGRRPVINVSWDNSKAYVAWLGQQTGENYRLLSEAEWEYACRAATTSVYAWGDKATAENANFQGDFDKTTEVGSYPANPWGLFDMHGNVWEWVEDIWHSTYEGAPNDGSAWITDGDSNYRVLRGGSWLSNSWKIRSVYRDRTNHSNRIIDGGFRVARTV